MSEKNPLAAEREEICEKDLEGCTEITLADPYVPSVPLADVKKAEIAGNVNKRIYVYERASRLELLGQIHDSFMWGERLPQDICDKYGLVQKVCRENLKLYKDVMIYRKGYKLTEYDKSFIEQVCEAKRRFMN